MREVLPWLAWIAFLTVLFFTMRRLKRQVKAERQRLKEEQERLATTWPNRKSLGWDEGSSCEFKAAASRSRRKR